MQFYYCGLLILLLERSCQVFGQTVPADKAIEANLGSNVVLEWNFDGSRTFTNVQSAFLYVERTVPQYLTYVLSTSKALTGNGKHFFPDNRLVVESASLDTGTLKLTLENVQFKDEKKKFILNVVYTDHAPKQSMITIGSVKGGPVLCNKHTLKTEYTFSECETPTISVTFCGNPKPTIRWSFNSYDITDNGSDTPDGTLVHGHRYDVVLPSLTQNVCGKMLSSSVSGFLGNNVITNTSKIFVDFVPAEIQNIVFFQESSICNSVQWSALDVGDCQVTYNVEYLNEKSISTFTATDIRTLRDCRAESLGATSVRVWAMYGKTPGKISNAVGLSITKTTTTTTTATSKRTVSRSTVPQGRIIEAHLEANIEWIFSGRDYLDSVLSGNVYLNKIDPSFLVYTISNSKDLTEKGKEFFPNSRLVVASANLNTGNLKLILKNLELDDEKREFILSVLYTNQAPKNSKITVGQVKVSASKDCNVVPITAGISIPLILILIINAAYLICRWRGKDIVYQGKKKGSNTENDETHAQKTPMAKITGINGPASTQNTYQTIHPYSESYYMEVPNNAEPNVTIIDSNVVENSSKLTSCSSNAFMNLSYEGDSKDNQTIGMSIQRLSGNKYLLPQDRHTYENA